MLTTRRFLALVLTGGLALSVSSLVTPTVLAHPRASMAADVKKSKGGTALSGTIVLTGTFSSSDTLVMKGALSVGSAVDMDWPLPVPTSVSLSGYREQVDPPTFEFTVPPTSASDSMIMGNTVRTFHWDHPPVNTVIRVTETLHVKTVTTFTPFVSADRYPLNSIPADVQPYLADTDNTRLPSAAVDLAARLAGGQTTERQVVTAVANWVASNTHPLGSGDQPNDAATVFRQHTANCTGYDNLMIGLLHQLGIPAQAEFGWVGAQRFTLPGPRGVTDTLGWSVPGSAGELHTWINVYFPDAGWVAFDPQGEKFFVDPRHIGFFTNIDATDVVDQSGNEWFTPDGDPAGTASDPFGAYLPNGDVIEMPGDVPEDVTMTVRDALHVGFRRLAHDVRDLILFSR